MKKVVIIGAGPSGLTLAYELLKEKKYDVTIIEKDSMVGGISKTVTYDSNKMDLGGHRFFTKDKDVINIWNEVLNSKDFLTRNRISRIFYRNKFFDYPVNLSFNTIKNLGIVNTIASGFSYLKSCIIKKEENNLENFYINRFGKKLYSIFFEGYTEKLWGISPKYIDSSWGAQRVKGLSIKEVIKDFYYRFTKKTNKNKQTSLIENFKYPKYGPGMMWDEMYKKIIKMGGKVLFNSNVIKLNDKNNKINEVIYECNDKEYKIKSDIVVSSMPIKDLVNSLSNTSAKIKKIANSLPYRDFITIGLIIKNLKIKNQTNIKTHNNLIPDTWIYIQSSEVKLGRIQVFNNWSEYLVKDKNTISLGLEYFCNENDDFWNMTDEELKNYAVNDLIKINILDADEKILNCHIEKVIKAYPAYFGTYSEFYKIKDYLNSIDNLYCIGRNGQHRYNNMDHSMKTALVCKDIILNKSNKNILWDVNTDEEYHEIKKDS